MKKHRYVFVLLAISALAFFGLHPVPAAAVTPVLNENCANRTAQFNEAWESALGDLRLSAAVAAVLAGQPVPDEVRPDKQYENKGRMLARRWFGNTDPQDVYRAFFRAGVYLQNTDPLAIVCSPDASPKGYSADALDNHTLTLYPKFWGHSRLPVHDSRSSILVHEIMHLSSRNQITDLAYGCEASKKLIDNPFNPPDLNASNYQYFVEEYTSPIVCTDPVERETF